MPSRTSSETISPRRTGSTPCTPRTTSSARPPTWRALACVLGQHREHQRLVAELCAHLGEQVQRGLAVDLDHHRAACARDAPEWHQQPAGVGSADQRRRHAVHHHGNGAASRAPALPDRSRAAPARRCNPRRTRALRRALPGSGSRALGPKPSARTNDQAGRRSPAQAVAELPGERLAELVGRPMPRKRAPRSARRPRR